jgi:hypothetical protein
MSKPHAGPSGCSSSSPNQCRPRGLPSPGPTHTKRLPKHLRTQAFVAQLWHPFLLDQGIRISLSRTAAWTENNTQRTRQTSRLSRSVPLHAPWLPSPACAGESPRFRFWHCWTSANERTRTRTIHDNRDGSNLIKGLRRRVKLVFIDTNKVQGYTTSLSSFTS